MKIAHRHIISEDGQIYLIGAIVDKKGTEEEKEKKARRRWWKLKKTEIFPESRDINVGVYVFNALDELNGK